MEDARGIGIGIVGPGYVGLPRAVAFAEASFSIVGIDSDPWKIGALLTPLRSSTAMGAGRIPWRSRAP